MAIFEDMWIEVQTATDPMVVRVCYRHPISSEKSYTVDTNFLNYSNQIISPFICHRFYLHRTR